MAAIAALTRDLCVLACVTCALAGAPLPARRLRAHGSNTHANTATLGTNFALDEASSFSWAASHEDRGASQGAFRFTITDAVTGRVVHDSGRVVSAHPTYELSSKGSELLSGRTYEWAVIWYDQAGQASPPSEPAAFHIGLSDPNWNGVPWLGSNTTNLYRTEGSVASPKTLAAATLYICALGYGKVTVGGKPASDGLMVVSGWTNNERMNYYETYDVSAQVRAAQLEQSDGATIALGVALGHGWRDQSKFPRHDPKDAVGDKTDKVFRAQLKMMYTDGSLTTAVTTAAPTWTTAAGPVTADSVYDGETYDARMEQPGWDMVGFDETANGWSPAKAVTDAPRGKMVASSMPKVAIDSVRQPVSVTNLGDRDVIDFGSNIAGWTSIKNMKGKAGDTVVLRHAEVMQHEHLPDLKGKINTSRIYTGNLRSAKAADTYILKGDQAGESYTPSFTYHGARYVEVTGFPGTLTAADVEYHHFHTANAKKSATKFSSPTIAAIQKMAIGAQRSNMMTLPTDCDQRDERLGWMGDADLSVESMLLNYDAAPFFTMFMKNMDSETNPDGSITDVVPLVRFGGRPADPSWSAALIEVAYQLYKIDGISAVAKAHWDKMLLHLQFYASAAAKSPTKWPKTKYGDWVPPPFPEGLKISGGPKPDKPMTSAFAWIVNLYEASQLATALGDSATAAKLNATATGLVAKWNAEWLHPNNTYGNGVQTTYTLPVHLMAVPVASRQAVQANFLANIKAAGTHLTTGIIGGKFFFEALSKMGQKDIATAVLEKTDYPSFGYMFSNKLEPGQCPIGDPYSASLTALICWLCAHLRCSNGKHVGADGCTIRGHWDELAKPPHVEFRLHLPRTAGRRSQPTTKLSWLLGRPVQPWCDAGQCRQGRCERSVGQPRPSTWSGGHRLGMVWWNALCYGRGWFRHDAQLWHRRWHHL